MNGRDSNSVTQSRLIYQGVACVPTDTGCEDCVVTALEEDDRTIIHCCHIATEARSHVDISSEVYGMGSDSEVDTLRLVVKQLISR